MKKEKKSVEMAEKPPADFEEPTADPARCAFRGFGELVREPTRDFLRKLSATADLAQYASRRLPDEFEAERRLAGEDYATIRIYFHLLAARAMGDRKLAKRLAPIFYELVKSAVYDKRFYADLVSMLMFKHKDIATGFPTANLKPEDVECKVQKLAAQVNINTIMEDWENFAREIEKEPPRKEKPNLMFG